MAEGWYDVRYVVGVHMHGMVWASSAEDAVREAQEEGLCVATGETYTVRQPTAKPVPPKEAPAPPSGDQREVDRG